MPGAGYRPGDAVTALLVLSLLLLGLQTGLLGRLDNALTDARFTLSQRPPTGELVVVAIDTKSLAANPVWPWPRAEYARLIDVLDEEGAAAIGFDLDFSAAGAFGTDQALADAVMGARAEVMTAVFRQPVDGVPGMMVEMLPNTKIRSHVTLASVAYPTSANGLVRMLPAAEPFSFGPVPSIGAQLSGVAPAEAVALDFGIDLDGIVTYSFSDVLARRVPAGAFAGKKVLVGATAIELGDEFSLPTKGLWPGVFLNALGYETLAQGRALRTAPPWTTLLLVGLVVATGVHPRTRRDLLPYALGLGVIGAGLFGLSLVLHEALVLRFDIGAPLLALVFSGGFCLLREAEQQAGTLFRNQMINQAQRLLFERLVHESHGGIITLNRFGDVELCNPQARKMLGIASNPVGKPVGIVAPALAAHVRTPVEPTSLRTAEIEVETEGEDEVSTIEVSISRLEIPLSASRFERRREPREVTLVSLYDATPARRAAEAERLAKEEHAAASEAKSLLIATMSHELRTPLNHIIGFAELIAGEMMGPVGTPEYTEYAGHIGTGGKRLLSVVNDMLLAGQLQSNEIAIYEDEAALEGILNEALDGLSRDPAQVEVAIAAHRARIDAKLVGTAVRHLVDNALKFGGGSDVRVSVNNRGDELRLRVEDDGPGVDLERAELTSLFVQADGTLARTQDGCGIGLFLVDGIARLHGGRLRLFSAPGRGFAAEVILPGRAIAPRAAGRLVA
nr:CHASE2 domain-containing protein [Parvularcula dongshanensis]